MQQVRSYQPSYIVRQDPDRFGGYQDDYIHQTNQIIDATAEKISRCRDEKGDLKKLFFEITAELSHARAQLAKEHGTKDAEDFGKRRDDYYPAHVSILVLQDAYKEYNDKLLSFFSNYLKQMESNGQFKKTYEIRDQCQGRTSVLEIEVINNQDLMDRGYQQLPQLCLPDGVSSEKLKSSKESLKTEEILEYRQKMFNFKTTSPQSYRIWKMSSALWTLRKKCPSPSYYGISADLVRERYPKQEADIILGNLKSLQVHAVLRTNIDGKLYALTEYFTWMYENSEWMANKTLSQHPIERMKQCSKVMLLHQDEFLIAKTLEEISKIFEVAVLWNRNTQILQDLKDTMGNFYYLSAHNMSDVRGSAARTEWLEEAIYRSHKIDTSSGEEKMLDLEAFANPLYSQFKKVYDQQTQLKYTST